MFRLFHPLPRSNPVRARRMEGEKEAGEWRGRKEQEKGAEEKSRRMEQEKGAG